MTTTLEAPGAPPTPAGPLAVAPATAPPPSRARRPWTWERIGYWSILGVAGFLYCWALSRNGYSNDYYSAAVLSGSKSWKAAFFGSLDTSGFITVDKPPLALWVDIVSVRIFAFSSWSLLLPQAIAGVGAVALLYNAVRRVWGTHPALLAAAVFALSPVTVATNRSTIPESILVLTLVAAAWATTLAIQTGRTRWVVLAMVFVGLGFNAKMLQAWIVLPALCGAYLAFGPPGLWRRIRQLAIGTVVAVAVSASWMVAVDLWPAEDRPYIGGSEDNSVFDLVLGYNGLGRVFGADGSPGGGSGGGPGGGPGGGGGFGGAADFLRMFNDQTGDQISWLLPLAAVVLVGGVALAIGRARRVPLAGWTLWGGWLCVHAFAFSYQEGIFHPYYVTQMAPALGAVVGAGVVALWRARREWWATLSLAAGVVAGAWWAGQLLDRTPWWNPWLGPALLGAGLAGAALLVVSHPALAGRGRPRLAALALAVSLAAVLGGPAAYSVTPLTSDPAQPNPEAGPTGTEPGIGGGGPGTALPNPGTIPGGGQVPGGVPGGQIPGGQVPDGQVPDGQLPGGGGPGVGDPEQRYAQVEGLAEYLLAEHDGERWIVAALSARGASPFIIATDGAPVMAMGGFGGGDPVPTAEQLADYVQRGDLRFVMLGGVGGGRGPGGGGVGIERDTWVLEHCEAVDSSEYGGGSTGGTLYDCASAGR